MAYMVMAEFECRELCLCSYGRYGYGRILASRAVYIVMADMVMAEFECRELCLLHHRTDVGFAHPSERAEVGSHVPVAHQSNVSIYMSIHMPITRAHTHVYWRILNE